MGQVRRFALAFEVLPSAGVPVPEEEGVGRVVVSAAGRGAADGRGAAAGRGAVTGRGVLGGVTSITDRVGEGPGDRDRVGEEPGERVGERGEPGDAIEARFPSSSSDIFSIFTGNH